jgi:hypothetical protein
MKKTFLLPYLVILAVFSLYGCRQQSTSIAMPDIGIPEAEMNKHFHLEVPDGWNTFKTGEVISINVDVIGDDWIIFPTDLGAIIFILDDGKWIEVANFMTYPEGQFLVSPSHGDPFKQEATAVSPILPDKKQPVTVRIVLWGHIYRDGQPTDERVASYVDVHLKP